MDGMPLSVKYRYPSRCRQRAYQARVKREAEAVGLPVAPTLKAVAALGGTRGRNGDAQSVRKPRQRRRTELRVDYRKAVRHAEATRDPEIAREVRDVLVEALPDRQRAALAQQGSTALAA
jgi:hypothetical protein